MLGWLYRFVVGRFDFPPRHQHEWETLESASITRVGTEQVVGFTKHLRCKTCGDWKRVQL